MKVFVTGGTGYIGSAVCLRLKKAGHDVQALVRDKEKGAPLQAAGVSAPGLSAEGLAAPIAAKKKLKAKKCKKGKVYSKKKHKCVAKKGTRRAAKMVAPAKK